MICGWQWQFILEWFCGSFLGICEFYARNRCKMTRQRIEMFSNFMNALSLSRYRSSDGIYYEFVIIIIHRSGSGTVAHNATIQVPFEREE